MRQEKVFSKDDIKLAKEKVFGPTTFWVTGVQVALGKPSDELLPERYDYRSEFVKRVQKGARFSRRSLNFSMNSFIY